MMWTQCLASRSIKAAVLMISLFFMFALTLWLSEPSLYASRYTSQHNYASTHIAHDHDLFSSTVRWSDYAYVQYITNENYLCNSVMIIEALHRLGARADRLMMFPSGWGIPVDNTSAMGETSRLLLRAKVDYGATLVPVQIQSFDRGDRTWRESFTKLLAFNQTQYKRVISLDSDATVQKLMDELFFLPPSPVAMPRAYWMDQPFLSSQLVVIEPSEQEWKRVEDFMLNKDDGGFDMDILNTLYKDTCTIIPHQAYDLLTGEFRGDKHEKYLGIDEPWNGTKILEEAKFVHFSDWPRPKPWLKASDSQIEDLKPKCRKTGETEDCSDRDIWLDLYEDFADRRERICGRRYDRKLKDRRSHEFGNGTPSKHEPVFGRTT